MTSLLERAGAFLRSFRILLGGGRLDRGPIDTVDALETFVASRSAYIAQKTLYGYVKTRMGIRYPAMFEDANIIASLNIAKVRMFVACLSDLTIYAAAVALRGDGIDNSSRAALARHCYVAGLGELAGELLPEFSEQECLDEFGRRLAQTEWHRADKGENFTDSPRALVRWTPIADNLKELDREIIENSVKFAWREVREQFAKRIRADSVAMDWAQRLAAGSPAAH